MEVFAPRLQWITAEKLSLSHKVSGKKGLSEGKIEFSPPAFKGLEIALLGAVARFLGNSGTLRPNVTE